MAEKKNIKILKEVVRELSDLVLSGYENFPVVIVDESGNCHKVVRCELAGENKRVNGMISEIFVVDSILCKVASIREVRDSGVEIALERSAGDLTEYQRVIADTVGCDNFEAVGILEKLNARDYLLLSGSNCRQLTNHIKRLEQDIAVLREKIIERG